MIKTKIIKDFEKGPIRRSLFDNGAVSLFHQMKGVSSAVVNLYFLAGSIFEKESEYGIAHVIEHMLFKEGGKSNLVSELEFYGAEINAYTYKEYVCFEMTCLATKVDQFLPKFLKLFLNPVFDLKELKIEKNVVVQELKEDKDDHETEAIEYLFQKNFDDKIGHSIGGSIINVKSFTKSDLESFYYKYFNANRMILSITSGRSFNSLESILYNAMLDSKNTIGVKKHFRLGSSSKFGKMKHFKTKLKRKMENSIVMFSFDGVSLESQSYYDLMILDEILFEGLSSVFFKLLREESGLVYGLGSSINSFVKTGNYVMVFNTQTKNIKILKNIVMDTLDQLAETEIENKLVKGIIERVIGNWEMSFDSPSQRCEYIALEEIYNTNKYSIEKMKTELRLVTNKRIKKLIKKITKNGYSELILGPEK
jgi:predicted Zn-dependent peptidase